MRLVPIRELPMLPTREPTCPAADKVAGATSYDGGVVCRIMERDQQAEDGVGMDPAQLEVAREGTGGVYLTVKSDPATVLRFCFGRALPVVTNADGQGRDHCTYCPVWQRYREREWERKRRLFEPVVEDGVAMGVEEQAEVTYDLDELAPPRAG